MSTQVILVDKNDIQIGVAEKLYAHQNNLCHRAFSVILTRTKNNNQQILLQKRQSTKYHCSKLWSNACCSHPQPGEDIKESAKNRLLFEMNIKTPIQLIGSVYYQTKLQNDLYEHEYDHIFHGIYQPETCNFNIEEVAATKWLNLDDLLKQINHQPQDFTPWLSLVLTKLNR